jgi:hypothetical protein
MWAAQRNAIRTGSSEKTVILSESRTLSFGEVIAGWRDSEEFRAFFIGELAAAPWPAFFWEMPPIRRGHLDLGYEYVAIRSEALEHMRPDAHAFTSQMRTASQNVLTFPNLGGDALLVAPRQIGSADAYGHIAAFLRAAPPVQQNELFQALAGAIAGRLESTAERIWVSTSGLGVPWVHVRLDSCPKYYNHQPYARL